MRNATFWILFSGLIFRLTAVAVPPSFSDDLYRYRWEGVLQEAGGNPYTARPADPEWASLRDSTYDRVVLKEFKGGYGPLWMMAERLSYQVAARLTPNPESQVFWMKIPAVLAELGLLFLMPSLLAAYGLRRELTLLYAWNPLTIFEFWVEGHNDAWPVLAVALALWAAGRGRWAWAFGFVSLGVAAKYWPALLFLPLFFDCPLPLRARVWRALIPVPVLALCLLPFWTDLLENAQFMTGFVGGWRNNDVLYGGVLWLSGGDVYLAKYLTFGLVSALVGIVTWRRMPLPQSALAILTGTLLLSSNLHPWYLTWLTPLIPFVSGTAAAPLLLWQALIPFAYWVRLDWELLGHWVGVRPERWWIHGPVLAWLAAAAVVSRRNRTPSPPVF